MINRDSLHNDKPGCTLPNDEQKVQECDATMINRNTIARLKKNTRKKQGVAIAGF